MPQNLSDPACEFEFEEVPVDIHPFCIVAPQFAPPGILDDREPTESFLVVRAHAFADFEKFANFPKKEGTHVGIFQPFNPQTICRSVAKIAHGAAVAELGLNAFEPLLPDIILGKSKLVSHLIGHSQSRGLPADQMHRIALSLRQGYVIATVQLFAKYRIQPFLAVVGIASPRLSAWHMSSTITDSATPR